MKQPPEPPYFERDIDLWKLLLLSLLFGCLLFWALLDGADSQLSALSTLPIFAASALL